MIALPLLVQGGLHLLLLHRAAAQQQFS